jgi:hypothetical protein
MTVLVIRKVSQFATREHQTIPATSTYRTCLPTVLKRREFCDDLIVQQSIFRQALPSLARQSGDIPTEAASAIIECLPGLNKHDDLLSFLKAFLQFRSF